jgi:hypothetical protein
VRRDDNVPGPISSGPAAWLKRAGRSEHALAVRLFRWGVVFRTTQGGGTSDRRNVPHSAVAADRATACTAVLQTARILTTRLGVADLSKIKAKWQPGDLGSL